MRFKNLVRLVEDMMHVSGTGGMPRADMFMAPRLLALAMVLGVGGIGCGVMCFVKFHIGFAIGCPVALAIAIGALLCWRNQTIHIVDEETFVYTTFLGNSKVYKFADITKLVRNKDSYTLYVGNEKVHIDGMAILSKRLVEKINEVLGIQ